MATKKRQISDKIHLLDTESKHIKSKIKKRKKVGRPKKRGPKKKRIRKKINKIVKPRPIVDFKIITTINGKQNSYIGSYKTYIDGITKLKELEESNKLIMFPRKYINSETIGLLKDEYLLLEKNRYGDKTSSLLRNEFGKFIKNEITNNTKWVIRDKVVRLVEETFWVYGYDNKTDRKTFKWIYDNLLINAIDSKYDIIRVLVYKNKLIIKYDNKPTSIIFCKNKSDAIRLYNLLSDYIKKEKTKQVIFIGSYNVICDSRRELEKELIELTGWNKTKLQRSTT